MPLDAWGTSDTTRADVETPDRPEADDDEDAGGRRDVSEFEHMEVAD